MFNGGDSIQSDYSYICAGTDKTEVDKCYCDQTGTVGNCNGSSISGSETIRTRATGWGAGSSFVKKGEYWQVQYFKISSTKGTAVITVFQWGN
jgi:hypothetical protein